MQEDIIVNVQLTREDYKDYFFSKNKMMSVSRIFFVLFLLLIVLSDVILLFSAYIDVFVFAIGLLPAVIFGLLAFLPLLSQYRSGLREYMSYNAIKAQHCYKFSDNSYTIATESGNSTIRWASIDKTEIVKSCVIIGVTPYRANVIPKRFFSDDTQFRMFLNLISNNVMKKKLKIKNRSFPEQRAVKVEYLRKNENSTAETTSEAKDTQNLSDVQFEMRFKLMKKDMLEMNFSQYFVEQKGIVFLMVGVALLVAYFFIKDVGSFALFPLVFGIILTIGMPVLLYFVVSRMFKKESFRNMEFTYRISNDGVIVAVQDSANHVLWGNLYKATVSRNLYILWLSTRIGYIIPKRIISGLSDENKLFFEACIKKVRLKKS